MLQSFKLFIYKKLFAKEYHNYNLLLAKYKLKILRIKEQNTKIQRYENMLANRNAATTIAQSIYITNHAVERYIERIDKNMSVDEARKLLYKRTLSLLTVMDKLPDGSYEITKNAIVVIRNNTVCTVIKK